MLVGGAVGESSAATGIDGDQQNNDAEGSGAAYVFVRHDTGWSQQAYTKASHNQRNAYFGASIALSPDGRLLAIGAYALANNMLAVGALLEDGVAPKSGAGYVFR